MGRGLDGFFTASRSDPPRLRGNGLHFMPGRSLRSARRDSLVDRLCSLEGPPRGGLSVLPAPRGAVKT